MSGDILLGFHVVGRRHPTFFCGTLKSLWQVVRAVVPSKYLKHKGPY